MTKDPPKNETAGQTGIWHGGNVASSTACLSDGTSVVTAASKPRANSVDRWLHVVVLA